MFGWIMPEPLAMPPTVMVRPPSVSVATTILTVVSVVMMARAASSPPSRRNWLASAGIAASIRAMGNGFPITPVEATKTSSGRKRSAFAVTAAIFTASAYPWRPVQALALPLFTRMARPLPRRNRWRSRRTGAATTLLRVKTPATVASRSETINARSRTSPFLIPAAMPAASIPGTAVIPPLRPVVIAILFGSLWIEAGVLKPQRFVPSLQEVERLNGLAGRALDQIVEGGHQRGRAGPRIDEGRDLAEVGAAGMQWIRRLSWVQHPYERLVLVEVSIQCRQLFRGAGLPQAHVGGAEYAPRHGHQMRGERDGHAELLFDLRDVPVGPQF